MPERKTPSSTPRRDLIGAAAAAVAVSAVGSKAKAASNKKFKLKYAPYRACDDL